MTDRPERDQPIRQRARLAMLAESRQREVALSIRRPSLRFPAAALATASAIALACATQATAADRCLTIGQSCNVSKFGSAATVAKEPPAFPGNGPGEKGGDGGDAAGIEITLSAPVVYREDGTSSPLQLLSQGADGEQGSNATKGNFTRHGGDGGRGGSAGTITVTTGVEVGGYSATIASGATIISLGGRGGAAGIGNYSAAPGTAGVGGDGRAITATLGGGWSSSQGFALFVASAGGTGGRGRFWAAGYSETAPDGTTGGTGGSVQVSLLGAFTGGGGARIFSTGGDGGIGGEGSGGTGATGGDGGDGGGSSQVSVTLGPAARVYTNADVNAALWASSSGGAGAAGGGGGSGGHAGAGGAAGNVTIALEGGTLRSVGRYSPGLLAQSLGGAGANGGSGSPWAVGPNGGAGNRGGNAGNVSVRGSGGTIITGTGGSQFAGESSPGVLAQSIGGGGGSGGNASGVFAIGGNAANAVAGRRVAVDLDTAITTYGYKSAGIAAQSIGGGGGNGGDAKGTSLGLGLIIGGAGGGGGNGDTVTATLAPGGTITTAGDHAEGMRLQSIGGGGGDGGAAYGKVSSKVFGLSMSVGGSGGSGGMGGEVGFAAGRITTNAGTIRTSGADAIGILGQSIGGGGGAGGSSVAIADTSGLKEYPTLSLALAVGGSGGSGGGSNAVRLGNAGLIETTGAGAAGIVGQSIGGGGGIGGDASAQSSASGKTVNLSASVALGGRGRSAGSGGSVTLGNDGTIFTAGDDADGMVAQSIGGGGGMGGFGDGSSKASDGKLDIGLTMALGGDGGGGGAGGPVTTGNTGKIVTGGDGAAGLLAQSVGGGGGRAGGAEGSASGTLSVTMNLGGIAGSGGSSYGTGPVAVTNAGAIATRGADAAAILAQSIGGGGGVGGKAAGTDAPATQDEDDTETSQSINLVLTIGGRGGTGGAAGGITVGNTGKLATAGAMSDAIVAQAVGGGGGKGGAATAAQGVKDTGQLVVGGVGGDGGNGGQPTVTNTGAIATAAPLAAGIVAQSIAGGGGIGGLSGWTGGGGGSVSTSTLFNAMAFSLGGSGGKGGTSGQAVVDNGGAITTYGHDAVGIIAQSIAGGGGIVKTMSTSLETGENAGTAKDYALNLRFGGSGATSGASGLVRVTTREGGDIRTYGDNAFGVVAQSIAGGGGLFLGGSTVTKASKDYFGTGRMTGSVINDGGGNSGVWIATAGDVVTSGNGAVGIWAQSIGGGGGIAGDKGWTEQLFAFQSASNHSGSGGAIAISVDATSTIATSGANAPAIVAQSIGGGGGRVTTKVGAYDGTAGGSGTGGTINVAINGTVVATGRGSKAIYLQSVGDRTSASPISVTVGTTGYVSGGQSLHAYDDSAPAIHVDHGGMSAANPNRIVNHGTLTSLAGGDGTAIYSAFGHTVVENDGAIVGAIKLGNNGGSGSIDNRGVIDSGTLALGGGTFVNAGTWIADVGGGAATLSGNYVGTTGSRLVLDADFAGAQPGLAIEGTASFAGEIDIVPLRLANHSLPLVTAAGGLASAALAIVPDTLFAYDASAVGTTLEVTPRALFAARAASAGLDANEQSVAGTLQQMWDAGIAASDLYTALGSVEGATEYRAALDSLSGEALGAIAAFRFSAPRAFLDSLEAGCQPNDAETGRCAWAKFVDSAARQRRTPLASDGAIASYHADGKALQVGGQALVGEDLLLAGAFAYEDTRFTAKGAGARISGHGVRIGAALDWRPGAWRFTGTLAGGHGWYRSRRAVVVGDYAEIVAGKPELWHWDAALAASYRLTAGAAYLRPRLAVGATGVHAPGYAETGAGRFDLALKSASRVALQAEPSVELGARLNAGDRTALSLFGSVGGALSTANRWTATATLAGSGAASFAVATRVPSALLRLRAGAELTAGDLRLQLQYERDDGQAFRSRNLVIRAAIDF